MRLSPDAIRALGEDGAIGFDQMITLERSPKNADVFMRIHNKDGGEVDACGNATRCVGWLVMGESGRKTAVDRDQCRAAQRLRHRRAGDGHRRHGQAALRLARDPAVAGPSTTPAPSTCSFGPVDAPILSSPSAVSMGNPHAIFWVDDVEAIDLARIGPILEHHPMFPERANISLAHVTARDAITVKTWERGVGLTKACGTAACAAAVAAMRKGLCDHAVTVTLPGGPLRIEWREDGHVMMTGPVETEFTGLVDPETLRWSVTEKGAA